MREVFDAAWRAAITGCSPRLLAWSLLPVLTGGGAIALLGWFYWEPALDAVRAGLEGSELLATLLRWLADQQANQLRSLLAPLLVVMAAVPLVALLTLLLVGIVMTPAIVSQVADRRFPGLARLKGAGFVQSLVWSLACTAAALLALAASVPLWLVPPLALVLPALIGGWLAARVFTFDVLADHASAAERRLVMRRRRWPLLGMGLGAGVLAALPTAIWGLSALTLVFAPVLLAVSVWLYTIVFGYTACWFAHYALGALHALRQEQAAIGMGDPDPESPAPAPAPAAST